MKRTFTSFTLLLLAINVNSQVVTTTALDFNNTSAHINNNGIFFNDLANAARGYEVPKGSGINAVYMMNIMAIGEDINGQLKAALTNYEQSDFFYGPVTEEQSQYNTPSYQNSYSTLWTVSKSEVDQHIANWNTSGYTPPASLLNWPGNGNIMNGEPAQLAPFHDVTQDGIYNPLEGDYPIIRGDKAVFCILNDRANIHPSEGAAIGLEVHLLFYQYDQPGALENTTFIHAELINRGTQTLYNFHFGSFVDFDLGGYADDYLGTSVDQNMAYVYNSDLFDGSHSGISGYGNFPPAVGVITLNKPLYSHVSGAGQPFPGTTQTYNLLKGLYTDGSPQLDDNNEITRYHYYGYGENEWTEAAQSNPLGDRRSYISFEPITLSPFSVHCYDYAVLYSRSTTDSSLFSSTGSLMADAAVIQDFYDNQTYECTEGFLGVDNPEAALSLTIYPNPASDRITLSGVESGIFEITSMHGKRVSEGIIVNSAIDLQGLQSGCYLLQVSHQGTIQTIKLIKKD